ncbi:YcgL domain-containing protein [Orbaceae bacterium ESL0727]|nr:YcgL domain-containing protein [Orbaceae bacterium ESL0727]
MWCYIYRSSKKENCYLYIDKENDFSAIPENIRSMFGKPIFVMKILLDTRRHFAACPADEIEARIKKDGFFLQMLNDTDFQV